MHVKVMEKAVEATRDGNSAWLLERIVFWMQHATIQRAGCRWVANSQKDWQRLTNLSAKQVETALARLRRLGLIKTESRHWKQRLILHASLTPKLAQILGGLAEASNPVLGVTSSPHLGVTGNPRLGVTIIHGETTGRTTEEKVSEQGLAMTISESTEAGDCGEMMSDEKKKNSVKDVLETHKAKAVLHQPDTVKALEFMWKKIYSEEYGEMVPAFTMKQYGQLKMFRDKCPAEKAGQIVEFVLRNWVLFAKTAADDAGLKSSPERPQIDFLLKHIAAAFKVSAPKQKVVYDNKPLPIPAIVQSIAAKKTQSEKDMPQTYEELMAIMNADDDLDT